MNLGSIFFIGLFSLFLAGVSQSSAFGWGVFIVVLGVYVWGKTAAGYAAQRKKHAGQIKFADLRDDSRFNWADDAGWLGKAVGTSHYAAALDRINRTPGDTVTTALLLVPDPDNPHDENAVAVCHSNGLMLGHLDRSDNTEYLKKLRKAAGRKCIATVNARVGCFKDEKTGERMHFIRLAPNDS